ncbi:MAG TPA: tRNA pseudouridine(38-40) synthase TruA [Myxococcota bacterium]|nr:tRNA pseudouridine(38-40) synthase TruA [Myxococcota bacterium]
MGTFRLVLEYDGADFAGWQRQAPGTRAVQTVLEEALARIVGHPAVVVGASRTDAGVHAEGQVASTRLETALDAPTLRRALNATLPDDVAVRALGPVPDAFHALRDARSKLYCYAIWNGDGPSPLRARRFHYVPGRLDVGAMREAARGLVGRHDFASFQTRAAEWRAEAGEAGRERSTERTLTRLELRGEAGGELHLEVEGNGFLRHMVRTIVGTLVEVGRGRRSPRSLADVLAARSRLAAGPTAPALGLTLVRVGYAPPAGGGAAERLDPTRA